MAEGTMNTKYSEAKIIIGSNEYSSENYRIDSITITEGCYDGSVIGFGAVYSPSVSITMQILTGITKGTVFTLYFCINGVWKKKGTFFVNDLPVENGGIMTVEGIGVIGQYESVPLTFPGKKEYYTLADVQSKIEAITGYNIVYIPELDEEEEEKFLGQKVSFLKDIEDYVQEREITTDVTVRTAIAGIAILFGGNAYEWGSSIVIRGKSYRENMGTVFTGGTYDTGYNYSQLSYGIRSLNLSFLPWNTERFTPPNATGEVCTVNYVSKGDRVSNTLLVSALQGDVLFYDFTTECDWIGWTSDGGVYDMYTPPGGKPSPCYTQGDLVYKTGEFSFIGYNDTDIVPGNVLAINVDDRQIDLYCGEIVTTWDGGFMMTVSSTCSVESDGSYQTNSSDRGQSSTNSSQAVANYNNNTYADKTLSNVEESTIDGKIFKDGTINGSKIEDSSITGSQIKNSTITGSNILEGTITGSNIKAATITGSLIVNGTIRNEHIMESTIDGSKILFSSFEDGVISGSAIDTSTFTDGQISGSVIDTSTFKDGQISGTSIDTSTFKDGTIKGSVIESSTLKNIPYASMDKAFINDLIADDVFADSIKATVIDVGALTADEADLKYATITSLNAVDGKIITLSSKAITTDNLSANVAKLGYLSADSAELSYAKIDFSNVGSQVVKSSMIVDGAVTNEKVSNLSANKITSGTIDASKIVVTNLNADNLTVGTINGKLIGKGSVDLNKLSEEVPTKEYLDSVQENLQGQIDGAIETFTKTEIPTLNNEPASLWTDNDTKKKHIGDICYVVNPTSSADGYCYRFANLGTEASPNYSWVLIKDSDVTKALQDIIEINGEITGIKKFDTEISSWKTDTDSELSSLKNRTSTLETDMGTKVETSTFNELKQTVSENSSSITTLSTTVSKKADSSTVSELSNTVNSVKQTADSNTSSISSLQTTVSKKADSSTVSELSNRTSTLEQDLTGFKTTVSNTYTTKTDFENLEIGGTQILRGTNTTTQLTGTGKWENGTWRKASGGVGTRDSIVISDAPNPNITRGWNIKSEKDGSANDVAQDGVPVSSGNTYTLSCYAKGNGVLRMQYGKSPYPIKKVTIDNDNWEKCSFTFTIGETSDGSTDGNTNIYVGIHGIGEITFCGLKLEKGNKPTDWTPAPEDTDDSIESVKTIATQAADKFEWLVSSGTNATNFTLTDRMATLIADTISLNGNVKVNGDMLVDGSVNASKIDVKNLFSQDIVATGTITGAKLYGTYAEITSGKIGGMIISNGDLVAEYAGSDGNYSFAFGASNNFGLKITKPKDGVNYNVVEVDRYGLKWGDSAVDTTYLNIVPGGFVAGAEEIILNGNVKIPSGKVYESGQLLSNLYCVSTYGTVTISGTGAWVQKTATFGKTYASQPLINIMPTTQFASENIRFVSFTGSSSAGYTGMTYEVYTATKSFSYGIRWMAIGNIKH